MNIPELTEHVSELRWLAYELGNEMKTLETTAHPLAHQFLMHGLARRMALVAQRATEYLTQPVLSPVARPSEEEQLPEQSVSSQRVKGL